MKRLITMAVATLCCVALAAPPEGGASHNGTGPGNGAMGSVRDPILRMVSNPKIAEKLSLSEDQRAKLKEIRKASEANRGAQKKIREASKKQAELMKAAKIDEAAVMAAIDEVFEARKAMAKAQTKRIIAVKSILTPEQIEKFYGEIVKEQKERGARRTGQRPCAQKCDSDGKSCPKPEAE